MPTYAYMAAHCPSNGAEITAVELGEHVQDKKLPVHLTAYVWDCPQCGALHVFNELEMRVRFRDEPQNET